jgi:hypothetical protein
VIRTDPQAPPEDRVQYLNGQRYLPEDEVSAIAPDESHGVWVRTKSGRISHIELKPMTLAQKADYFEQRVHARHDRWGQVSNSELKEPGNLATNQLRCEHEPELRASLEDRLAAAPIDVWLAKLEAPVAGVVPAVTVTVSGGIDTYTGVVITYTPPGTRGFCVAWWRPSSPN